MSSCVELNQQLSCVDFANAGCNCYGCCFESLPPPSSPPPPPSPLGPPPSSVAAFNSTLNGVEICGDIDMDARLEVGTTYVLTCPTFVVRNATLHVDAGVNVEVAGASSPAFSSVHD
jgi:hypothetical protein